MNGNTFKVLLWAVGFFAMLLVGLIAYDLRVMVSDLQAVKAGVQANKETLIGIEHDIESLEKSLIQSHRGGIPLLKSIPLVGGVFKERLDIEEKPKRKRKEKGGSWEGY